MRMLHSFLIHNTAMPSFCRLLCHFDVICRNAVTQSRCHSKVEKKFGWALFVEMFNFQYLSGENESTSL